MRVLVANTGSSSLKLSVVDGGRATSSTELGQPSLGTTVAAMVDFSREAGELDAVGHRIVHGGPHLTGSAIVDARVRAKLDTAAEIAPLHVPAALHVLDVLRDTLHIPHVVCLDTAFHASLPAAAHTYAIPSEWRGRYGVRRYGFHGLSCAWSLRRAAELLRRDANDLRLLVAHLGAGASVTAIRDSRSADTTMGFTPLEGLVMATRSGTVDPGALLWLQAARGMSLAEVSHALEQLSGTLGLGGSADMRALLAMAAHGDERAVLARDVYVHRARALTAAMAASLDRLDTLVFTGGVGEHAGEIRAAICAGLRVIGVDARGADGDAPDDRVLSPPGVTPAVLVVHAREDLEIAREVRLLLGG